MFDTSVELLLHVLKSALSSTSSIIFVPEPEPVPEPETEPVPEPEPEPEQGQNIIDEVELNTLLKTWNNNSTEVSNIISKWGHKV
jgi:hypothetical protein